MPEFGTSGLRGLAAEFTEGLVADYIRAFLKAAAHDGRLLLGRDLRASSPRIGAAVAATAQAEGLEVLDCGILPTPALALAAETLGTAAVMITGSHIPADRNGLKFYTAAGEITKADEAAIGAAIGAGLAGGVAPAGTGGPPPRPFPDARAAFLARYAGFFAPGTLAGRRIGVYQHSSTARDLLVEMLGALGATPVPLGRSESFVAVDTEAIDPGTRALIAGWAAEHRLDALVSVDGDADRPMLAGPDGAVVPGDVLGPLTALYLGAARVVTPVSSNTLVERMGRFEVARCRIGSPFVIAAMQAHPGAVVGYEANGGFLTGFTAEREGRRLAPLMTRDFALPILAVLALAAAEPGGLAALLAGLPPRFTASDRLRDIPRPVSDRIVAGMIAGRTPFDWLGPPVAMDTTDGARASFADGTVVHVRPSGNAPELRCYVEAGSAESAAAVLRQALAALGGQV